MWKYLTNFDSAVCNLIFWINQDKSCVMFKYICLLYWFYEPCQFHCWVFVHFPGLDTVTTIASIPTYKPSERIQQYNDLAAFLGDKRAQQARTIWNRPLKTVYISDCGELKVTRPSLSPSLPWYHYSFFSGFLWPPLVYTLAYINLSILIMILYSQILCSQDGKKRLFFCL